MMPLVPMIAAPASIQASALGSLREWVIGARAWLAGPATTHGNHFVRRAHGRCRDRLRRRCAGQLKTAGATCPPLRPPRLAAYSALSARSVGLRGASPRRPE